MLALRPSGTCPRGVEQYLDRSLTLEPFSRAHALLLGVDTCIEPVELVLECPFELLLVRPLCSVVLVEIVGLMTRAEGRHLRGTDGGFSQRSSEDGGGGDGADDEASKWTRHLSFV